MTTLFRSVSFVFFLTAAIVSNPAGDVFCQEREPELELDTYRIIGKDTRVFTILGDRMSTVRFLSVPLKLAEEERDIEESDGLIDNEERLVRPELFDTYIGPYAAGEIKTGSESPADFWAKASYDLGTAAGSLVASSRMAEVNTPFNTAPFVKELHATGFYGGLGTRYYAGVGYRGDSEELFGSNYRKLDRETSLMSAIASIKTGLGGWDANLHGSLLSGSSKYDDIALDENELDIDGNLTLTGELYDITLVSDSAVEYMKFGGDSGTVVNTGLKGMLLLWGGFGFSAGADLYVLTLGDEDTEIRVYPEVGFEWSIVRSLYARAAFKPGITPYSHNSLFWHNGLIDATPMAVEDRKISVDGEIGWRFTTKSLLSVSVFSESIDDALIFDRAGSLFTVVPGADVDVTGFRTGLTIDTARWGIDGDVEFRDVSWNLGGDVPYMPAFKSIIDGYVMPGGKWKLTGRMSVFGEHYVAAGSNKTVDGFMTLDCGVERAVLRSLAAYVEIHNITNAEGAWWTSQYQIPGTGLFAGIRAGF